jgi:hypothetical protein
MRQSAQANRDFAAEPAEVPVKAERTAGRSCHLQSRSDAGQKKEEKK